MSDKKPMFSAVIAAYNVEEYIEKCIESISNINNEELELIIVIGNKTDRTNELCDTYCDGLKVKVIRQNGRGLSNARNCGMDAATGRYIFFVDGDDSVRTEALREFLRDVSELAAKEDFDVLVNDFYFTTVDGDTLVESKQIETTENKFLNNQYLVKLVEHKGTFWNTWRFLLSRSYLQSSNMRFKENSVCEDLDFTIRLLLGTEKIWFCHIPYYNYCPVRSGSLMNSKTNKMVQDFLCIQEDVRMLLRRDETVLSGVLLHKLDKLLILCLPDIYEVDRSDRDICAKSYQKFIKREIICSGLYKIILSICKTDGIYVISYFLYRIKVIRRKIRYG